jgi:hypothetical protein
VDRQEDQHFHLIEATDIELETVILSGTETGRTFSPDQHRIAGGAVGIAPNYVTLFRSDTALSAKRFRVTKRERPLCQELLTIVLRRDNGIFARIRGAKMKKIFIFALSAALLVTGPLYAQTGGTAGSSGSSGSSGSMGTNRPSGSSSEPGSITGGTSGTTSGMPDRTPSPGSMSGSGTSGHGTHGGSTGDTGASSGTMGH